MPLSIVLGLSAASFWGGADFLAGTESRRLSALAVILWSQAAGTVLMMIAGLAFGPDVALAGSGWAVAAGACGGVGLLLFYRALALGTMSVVAPVAASGAVVPVTVAFALGDIPGPLVTSGIVLALAGVILVSRSSVPGDEPLRAERDDRRALPLALAAALGLGVFLVLMSEGLDAPGASAWWLVGTGRIGSLVVLSTMALGLRTPPPPVSRVGVLTSIGILDVSATVSVVYGLTMANLAVVAVLAAQHPVVTVFLARFLLDERLNPIQVIGVTAALVGLALLATG